MNCTGPTSTGARARIHAALAVCALVLVAGCAVGPDRRDPLEPFNRNVMKFNESVDAIVLKPVATAYQKGVPAMARTGVSNFFGNLGDGWSAINSALQFKLRDAADNWFRLNVNTLLGLGGLLDIASEMGIERHREDFGQTLGRWGVPTGPFLMLPLLGPSTFRDTAAIPIDRLGNPIQSVDPAGWRNSLYTLRVVDGRSNLLRASAVLDDAALDKYSFTRDAHLQRRRAEVYESGPRSEDSNAGSDAAPAAPPAASSPASAPAR